MTMATQRFETLTLAQLPEPALYPYGFVIVSDQNNALYYCDGTRWTNAGASATPRLINSGSSDVATTSDGLIVWKSAATTAKSQSIPAATALGETHTIKDAQGNCATYNITITPTSGTIDFTSTFVMNVNYMSITLVSDGAGNWMII